MGESGSKPEHKQLASIKESKKESGEISTSNRKKSFYVDSFRESMSYNEDFDDNLTFTQSRAKDSAIAKFNNYNVNTAEKPGIKSGNIKVDGKLGISVLTFRILQR